MRLRCPQGGGKIIFQHTCNHPLPPGENPFAVNNNNNNNNNKQTNSAASVRQRTLPTERPPLVIEVSANFIG
jgi:hypothetical protein